jgi:hypothetical protein
MRRYVFRLAILGLAVLGPSVVRGDDQQIAQQIVKKLQAEKQAGTLKGFSIDLSVEEGTVWLSGRVADEDQQYRALDIARRIPGVTQVVNDLSVAEPQASHGATAKNVFSSMSKAISNRFVRQDADEETDVQPASAEETTDFSSRRAVGSGVVQAAQPVINTSLPQTAAPNQLPMAAQRPMPVYAGQASQMPLAFAQARAANYEAFPRHHAHGGAAMPYDGGYSADASMGAMQGGGGPVPMHMPGSGVGIAPARYDHPHMPGYAWPSYAAYPNYAAVTYPKQYSPTAWPYIGPFYPYPQVPLGWRKVTLEWDDGWWFLDFKDRRTMYNK